MSGVLEYPKLRWPIEIRVEKFEKQEVIIILCPIGLSKTPLALIATVAPILQCFEGSLSVQQIVEKFAAQGLTEQIVRELIQLLDDNLFLATPRFFSAQQAMHEEFTNSDTRPTALAGLSYSLGKEALTLEVDGYLSKNKPIVKPRLQKLNCLIAPHIDYRRGSAVYGQTYNYLRGETHELYILMGTAHQYSRHLYHLSKKHFDTPLGALPCNRDFMASLAQKYGEQRSFADEILHKKEHSLELQLPFLRRILLQGDIAPILVGGFHAYLQSGKYPENFEEYDRFVSSLAECVTQFQAQGGRVCFIAGVDMAHIGQSFGDKDKLSRGYLDQIRERDQIYLKAISDQNKHALFDHIAEDQDLRRICGFPTMYTIIDLFDRIGLRYSSELFNYQQAVDFGRECAVTFAGAGLYT